MIPVEEARLLVANALEKAVDDSVGGHSFRLGAVSEQDSVAQRGMCEGADVVGACVETPVEECPRLRPEDQ